MENNEPYYYYPAKLQLAWAYHYNETRYGEIHADNYIDKMRQAIVDRQNSGIHISCTKYLNKPPQTKAARIVAEKVYYLRWTEKPNQKRGYTIFYRIMSGDNIGVIDIFQD